MNRELIVRDDVEQGIRAAALPCFCATVGTSRQIRFMHGPNERLPKSNEWQKQFVEQWTNPTQASLPSESAELRLATASQSTFGPAVNCEQVYATTIAR